jgi:predicted MPP superfamily phosphohydrolase
MILLIILVISEFLTFFVFRHHYKGYSRTKYYVSTIINAILSIYMWILYFKVTAYKGAFDDAGHIWLTLNLTGAFCAILFPRVILDILHFTGKAIRSKSGGHSRSLTNAGIIIWIVIFTIISLGTMTRFNVRTENNTIQVEGLSKDLDGLTIVQISDIHMSGFYRNKDLLKSLFEKVKSLKPDILINSGDFVNIGWGEFDRNDTILSLAKGRLGNYAVLGNHDIGTYYPGLTNTQIDTNIRRMIKMVNASGYTVLNDAHTIIDIGKARLAIIGVNTKGRHGHMVHGDLKKALSGMDSVNFSILISHDPNHWGQEVQGKYNIDLTLSGHTHGGQMGILTKRFQWSPVEYFYPRWNGLYNVGKQYLYVNRGLGVLTIPLRICMPAEISVIKLSAATGPAGTGKKTDNQTAK